MLKQTGLTYESAKFAKALFVAEPKVGKTSFLVASALGVLPWQKYGGIVDRPEHLHILSFDSSALGGTAKFLTQTCGASPEALKFNVLNFQDDARRVAQSETEYDFSLYNGVIAQLGEIAEQVKRGGIHAVIISSVTGLAQAVQRAIGGPILEAKKGSNMDMHKWSVFAGQINELRNNVQADSWHSLWEAHISKPQVQSQDKNAPPPKESLQIQGQSGQNFAYNVEQVFRVRRQFGQTVPGSKCDAVYLDTRPALDFIANGRGFTESLEPKEIDLTHAFKKLGLHVGHWGAKSGAPKGVATTKPVARPVPAPRR